MESARRLAHTIANRAADWWRDGPPYKLLLIGETGSGKTSFLNLLCNCEIIQALGFEEGLDQFHQFNDIELENSGSRKMESKTSGVKLYNVQLGELKVGVIDTPGFGDSNGLEEDKKNSKKIIEALKAEEYINCVCLIVNGRQSRISATLRYVLTEITAILPRDVLNNVIVVFTNTADPLDLIFDPSEFLQYIEHEIKHQYPIENPYCRFEKAREKKGILPMDMIAKSLKRSFEETARTLHDMCKTIKDFKRVHTHRFVDLYETKQRIERKVLTMLTEYENLQQLEVQIKQAQEKATAALQTQDLNKDYRVTGTIDRYDVREEPHKRHNTLCGVAGCYSNCHEPCYLDKAFNKAEIRHCGKMNGGSTCTVCGHHYTYHYHTEARFVKVRETTHYVKEEMKKRFEAAASMEERNRILQNGLEEQKRQSEIKRKNLSEQLLLTIGEFHELGANRNYAQLLENQLAVIKQRLEGTVGEETEDLRQTRDEIGKKLQLVRDAMNKQWSTGLNKDESQETGSKRAHPDKDDDEDCCKHRRV